MEYDPIMCMMVDKTTSVKTKDTKLKDSKNTLDKAIRITDAEKFQNASGTILGEIVTKSGNKVVVRDPWGEEYRLSENDFNWLVRQRNTVPLDIRAVAEVKLN
jgi:hypothetical protein